MKAILKKEFLELIRTKKILILVIIFLFVSISSPIIAKLIPTIFKNMEMQGIKLTIPEATWRDSIDQFIKNISQLAIIVIVFMFAGSVAEEKNKKTLEMILTKPISRNNFIVSKYIAAISATILILLISSIIFYFYTTSIFGHFSFNNFSLLVLLVALYIAQTVALTIFCSTLFTNQIFVAGLSFFIEIVLVSILGSIDKISKYFPGYILGHYKNLIENGNISDFLPSVLVSLAIIVLLVYSSLTIFRKQEIEH